MSSYYELYDYVSNSDLSELRDEIFGRDKPEGIQIVYNFGNLVDTMITEKEKFNHDSNTIEDGSKTLSFTSEEIDKAKLMTIAAEEDSFLSTIIRQGKFQHIYLRKKFPFEYKGEVVFMPTRCKLDLLIKAQKFGGDIKTTACTSEKKFIESIYFFDYDRQGSFYMDMANLDRFVFIGISKKPNKKGKHLVFKFVMERGDATYLSGREKYTLLGHKYYQLLYRFNQFFIA